MSLQPSRDTRLITTAYPDEAEPHNQRKHYGLNQLDKYADPAFCDYNQLAVDDVEEQLNNNALRETYPTRVFATIGNDTIVPDRFVSCVKLGAAIAIATVDEVDTLEIKTRDGKVVGIVCASNSGGVAGSAAGDYGQLYQTADVNIADTAIDLGPLADVPPGIYYYGANADNEVIVDRLAVSGIVQNTIVDAAGVKNNAALILSGVMSFDVYHDLCQPLSHPYFRDNAMRDNTLVNVRYFDCTVNFDQTRFVEVANSGDLHKFGVRLTDSSTTVHYTNVTGDTVGMSQLKPHLSFDLVTPSVPLPTISDKVISTYHTMVSPSEAGLLSNKELKSANIQLAQVPDRIYVFARSDKMLDNTSRTRLGVCTSINVRTPQNSGFLSQMSQDEIYQMSCRNGSKQPRSSFMCTLGSIVCIDPEKDLGGYTNGVLVPFTFDVQGRFEDPCKSGGESKVWLSDLQVSQRGERINSASESWSLVVVCELQGHLYLMSDGTGKQTKSNLTVTEVADAIAEGIHHPTTFAAKRVSKMDSGVLGEVARATGTAGDDVRQILRE